MTRDPSRKVASTASAWKKRLGFLCLGVIVVAVCLAIRNIGGGLEKADANPPASSTSSRPYPVRQTSATLPIKSSAAASVSSKTTPSAKVATVQPTPGPKVGPSKTLSKPAPEIVAEVNGRKITRDQLAQECLRHHGDEVLETMRNKYLILLACQRQNITVTRAEVDAEIEQMSAKFKLPVDQWLALLKKERGISGDQYAEEIIWPTLALRRLAGEQIKVNREDIVREYETMYGKQIRARLIVAKTRSEAKKLHELAVANASDPEYFGNLAKEHSIDAPSAAVKGVIQPILQHGTFPEIEKEVFRMTTGEISPVIEAGGQFVILKKEGEIPAKNVKLDVMLSAQLEEIIRGRKLRSAAGDIFKKLQANATIVDVWNNPEKRKQMPDVAVLIDGKPIPMPEFIKACLNRYGQEILDGMIGRTLIEVACEKQNISVSEKELDEEIARSALLAVPPKADGSPDVKTFLETITKEQRMKAEVYRNDAVWPAVALRKLAGNIVKVTDEDLKKGFEANYGPRVRCLAIVLNNQRRANEVFEKARQRNTAENFGDLASQYSIEPGSQALRGEVPPIKKHGGQQVLEDEAFKLKPGEISGVIQLGDKFVILRCEGFTKPVGVKFDEVKQDIYNDLFDKKLRIAMGDYFERLQDSATIDNYLAGTSRSPNQKPLNDDEEANAASSQKVPSAYQKPKMQ